VTPHSYGEGPGPRTDGWTVRGGVDVGEWNCREWTAMRSVRASSRSRARPMMASLIFMAPAAKTPYGYAIGDNGWTLKPNG